MKKIEIYSLFFLMSFGLLLFSCSVNEDAADTKKNYVADNILGFTKKSSSIEKVVGAYDTAGNPTMTIDTMEVKRIFQNQLGKDGIAAIIDKVELRKGTVDGTSKEYYYLLGVGKDEKVKIATIVYPSLTLIRALIVIMRSSDFFNSTCSCNGCRRGCTPNYYENSNLELEWECTECQVGDVNDCRKTVTATP